jgi:glycosyltransferase involved in cell wall biosynthesis
MGEFPENPTRWSGRQLQALILNGLNRAAHVVCVSEATRRDLLRLGGLSSSQVSVNHNGLNYPFAPMPERQAKKRLQRLLSGGNLEPGKEPVGFILHVGANVWYKNRLGVLGIYSHLVQSWPSAPLLLMVGDGFSEKMRRFISEHDLRSRVVSVAPCPNEDLRALYSLAELFLFPSLYEGFGWPIIEAQACGCRVLTSNSAPMTEVGGEGAAFCDSGRLSEAAALLKSLLLEPADSKSERIQKAISNSARFSTQRMVSTYAELYRRILN